MDAGAIFMVALVALLAMAFLFLFATSRRKDAEVALATVPDDEAVADDTADDTAQSAEAASAAGALVPAGEVHLTGRQLERSVALERRTQGAKPPAPAAPPPLPAVPDEETLGVTRRQVLNRGIVTGMLLGISGFGGAMLAMLWPSLSGGFGGKVRVDKSDTILGQIAQTREPFYYAAGRFYLNPYPKESVDSAKKVTAYGAVVEGYADGFVALYQKCVHLGCRVPWCKTSQWFECPCHGSQYNRVGEKKGGPAPRGLDRFRVTVEGGVVVVDTSLVIPGPPIGTNTTGQEAEGPHCIGQASE
jgi:cytochrome b6-f complex iron-sulfur subunit